MAVSKVNIHASSFSYAEQPTDNASVYSMLKKILVSGFTPTAIVSLTVVNKKARVITVEKDFHTVPGVKMIMAGTGVPAIDDRQEIQEVFTDGFIFEVDTPDAVFTNGITYSPAPLGWTLLDQDATRMLFRSGSGAINEFCFQINEVNNASYWYKEAYITYNASSFKDIKKLSNGNATQLIPFWDNRNAYAGALGPSYKYWIYGDDAFVYICANRNDTYGTGRNSRYYNCCSFGVGELAPVNNRIPPAFIHGGNYSSVYYAQYYYDSKLFLGDYNGVAFYKATKEAILSFSAGARITRNNPTQRSGRAKSYSAVMQPSKQTLIPYEVYADYSKIGNLPGTYFVVEPIPGLSIPGNGGDAYLPQRLTINRKKRNCLYIGVNANINAANNNDNYDIILLDLTGPIR